MKYVGNKEAHSRMGDCRVVGAGGGCGGVDAGFVSCQILTIIGI